MLLAARNTDGSPMTPRQVRDNLMSIVLAGHETTASELAWAFQLLAHNPRVLNKLIEEIDAGWRRGVPDGDDQGGAAPPARVPVHDPAGGQAADRDRAAGPIVRRRSCWGASTSCTTTPSSIPSRTSSAPSASSGSSPEHLHVAAVGRGSQALSRPAPGHARDEDRAAHGAGDDDRQARRAEDRASALAERDRHPARGLARGA